MSVWTSPITIGFGAACVAALALTAATLKRHGQKDALIMGFVLLALWGISKVLIVMVGYWPTASMAPFVNALSVVICMALWVRKAEAWKLILALLMETRAFLHVYYWTLNTPTEGQAYSYILTLNVLFALELVCVSSPGGRVVASMVGDRLSRFRGGAGHALPALRKKP